MATVRPQMALVWGLPVPIRPQKPLNCLECERRDLNPHAFRHWILGPAVRISSAACSKRLRAMATFFGCK